MNRSWTRTAAWTISAALAATLLLSFFFQPLGWRAGLLLAAIFLLAAFRPHEALLIVAAVLPLSTILFQLLEVAAGGFRMIEALSLAYLAGWGAHGAATGRRVHIPPLLGWSAGALLAAAFASAIVSGAALLSEQGGDTALHLIDDWFRSYPVQLDAITFSVLFAEGIWLLLAVADACDGQAVKRQTVTRMIVVGAAAAAALNVLRIVNSALAHEHPWRHFVDVFLHVRVNVHYSDLNAAGSYFALDWFGAAGLIITSRGVRRGAAALLLVVVSTGLWLAGSRLAMASVGLITAAVALQGFLRGRRRMVAVLVAVLLLAGTAAAVIVPLGRHVADPALAVRIRMGLAKGAIAMAADHPMFGVGLGRFYDLSESYVNVPNYIVKENAHNNFLQILAELGVPGLLLFAAVLTAAGALVVRARPEGSWPLVAGLCAFLLTCLGGHPLLVPSAAFPFWMALGVAVSVPSIPAGNRLVRTAALILIVLFLISIPPRALAAIGGANVEHTSIGLSLWQREPDGSRFRWAGGRATFFAPGSARAARFRLRLGNQGSRSLQVRIFLDGREADRVRLDANDEWRTVRVILPGGRRQRFSRIDLETGLPGQLEPLPDQYSDAGGILAVGQLQVER